jgi:Flp pilus assembly protein TadG
MIVRPTRLTRRRRDDGGASAVEFALVMPFLLLLIFGLVQYGLWFWAIQGGADIARGAARLAATGQAPTCADFITDVEAQVDGFTPAGDAIEITRAYDKAEGNTGTGIEIGDRVKVMVQFDSSDMNFPFVPFIDDGIVSETAEARVDYVPSAPEDDCETP